MLHLHLLVILSTAKNPRICRCSYFCLSGSAVAVAVAVAVVVASCLRARFQPCHKCLIVKAASAAEVVFIRQQNSYHQTSTDRSTRDAKFKTVTSNYQFFPTFFR